MISFKPGLLLMSQISGEKIKFLGRQKKPAELSIDFIRRIKAKGVRIKATAADLRDTILQGLLPAILNSVMEHEL